MINFYSLTEPQQSKVWCLTDAHFFKRPDLLERYFGAGAPVWYENLAAALTDRQRTLVSDYWTDFQSIPFIAAFVLDSEVTE